SLNPVASCRHRLPLMPRRSPLKKSKPATKLGALPEWNLDDLYPGIDSPRIAQDLAQADRDCAAFEQDFKGKLSAMAAGERAGASLAEAIRRYEAIDDRLGRLISYASLLYAGDTTDAGRAKFYGDVQERVTAASIHLLFFTLELNRVDDAALDAAMRDPALGHYRPWIEDVRKEKPYQLEDRVEQLFHEKSMTGYAAWNRQFDELIASLRFKVGGKALAMDKEISDRWRGFKDVADARHLANRVEPEVVEALVAAVRAAYPKLSHR